MESNTRNNSRERINESYLRQMIRDDVRFSAQQRMRMNKSAPCKAQSVPACEMQGDGNASSAKRPLAMVYAEKQSFRELYDPQGALKRGTLFKELDFPFLGYKR